MSNWNIDPTHSQIEFGVKHMMFTTVRGQFAAFEAQLEPWDVAAGALLVREAGGVVSDFDGSDAVEHSHSVLAAPFKLMTPLRKIIEPRWAKARR